jgi:hypothetical protein
MHYINQERRNREIVILDGRKVIFCKNNVFKCYKRGNESMEGFYDEC